MSAVLLREAIGTLFLANWPEEVTPVAWPNKAFKPPAGSWVRLNIVGADTFQMEIGGDANQDRHIGALVVNCFTVLDVGDKPALQLAESVAQIFRTNKFVTLTGGSGGVRFRRPNIQNIGPDGRGVTDSAYYQVNVTVPFVLDFVS